MKPVYCVAMTDVIMRQNKTVPNATKEMIAQDRLKGITNASMAAVVCKCSITCHSVSLIRYNKIFRG